MRVLKERGSTIDECVHNEESRFAAMQISWEVVAAANGDAPAALEQECPLTQLTRPPTLGHPSPPPRLPSLGLSSLSQQRQQWVAPLVMALTIASIAIVRFVASSWHHAAAAAVSEQPLRHPSTCSYISNGDFLDSVAINLIDTLMCRLGRHARGCLGSGLLGCCQHCLWRSPELSSL